MGRLVESLICRLEDWLKINRPDYYAVLLPGLSSVELGEIERALGVAFPEDLRSLYAWKNGQDPLAFVGLFRNFAWLSSNELVAHWESNTMLLRRGDFTTEGWWSPNWIPFLHNGGGDLYCVDSAGLGGSEPILFFDHESESRLAEFDHLEAWLKTIVESFEAGCWREADGEMIPVDSDRINTIFRKNNPRTA